MQNKEGDERTTFTSFSANFFFTGPDFGVPLGVTSLGWAGALAFFYFTINERIYDVNTCFVDIFPPGFYKDIFFCLILLLTEK